MSSILLLGGARGEEVTGGAQHLSGSPICGTYRSPVGSLGSCLNKPFWQGISAHRCFGLYVTAFFCQAAKHELEKNLMSLMSQHQADLSLQGSQVPRSGCIDVSWYGRLILRTAKSNFSPAWPALRGTKVHLAELLAAGELADRRVARSKVYPVIKNPDLIRTATVNLSYITPNPLKETL